MLFIFPFLLLRSVCTRPLASRSQGPQIDRIESSITGPILYTFAIYMLFSTAGYRQVLFFLLSLNCDYDMYGEGEDV